MNVLQRDIQRCPCPSAVVEVNSIVPDQRVRLDQLEGCFAHAPREEIYIRGEFSIRQGNAWRCYYNAEIGSASYSEDVER
ncbi:hypothetical protein VRRI112168_08160 [Vreelandella rituensis]|uniref:Uncharacterized protein n=1 Tax=Vreelandella rituensis TaxID=2282306 RepID=A0A368TWI4_9GAMM|nr:hypothetical protein [Halomonas rituensis]RCV89038.1 hypothetical protein DU506_13495 [Halomonas rituensis]